MVGATAVVGTDPDRDETGADAVDPASSSSSGLRRSEISTLPEDEEVQAEGVWGWCWTQIMCAAVKESGKRSQPAVAGRKQRISVVEREEREW